MRIAALAVLALVSAHASSQEAKEEKSPSGLVYLSLKDGTGASPAATDTVKVHTWSPRLVKPSIDDGKKVRIAAIHPDFG